MLTEILSSLLTASVNESTNPLWYMALATALALVPIVIGLFTSFVKVSVVLGLVKSALGTQHAPSGLVTMALSIAITGFTMFPVFRQSAEKLPATPINTLANQDLGKLMTALTPAAEPWLEFLRRHTGEREKAVLRQAASYAEAKAVVSVDTVTADEDGIVFLLPGFLLTELKEAFAMGFVILLPCLVIDLIVANILMGLGMMMVTPTLISLPLKLFLFVVSDAWLLITQGLINSYAM